MKKSANRLGLELLELLTKRAHSKEETNKIQELLFLANTGSKINLNVKDKNIHNPTQQTTVHKAAMNGHIEYLKTLIKAGADVEKKDVDGYTPLHLAIEFEQTKAALALIEAGADINAECKGKWTPLHIAATHSNGAIEIALALIQAGADINAKNCIDQTPLHLAAAAGNLKITNVLIQAGADINAQDICIETPLHMAACKKNGIEIIEALHRAGADINLQDDALETPLHVSTSMDNIEGVKTLLNLNANKEIKNKYGKTPLQIASWKNNQEMIALLTNHQSKEHLNIFQPLNEGSKKMTEQTNQNEPLLETPFENAVTLIAKNTVFHAIEKGDLETVKSYVETGFQVNADLGVATPLSVATAHNQAEIADFLILQGADINNADMDGGKINEFQI